MGICRKCRDVVKDFTDSGLTTAMLATDVIDELAEDLDRTTLVCLLEQS